METAAGGNEVLKWTSPKVIFGDMALIIDPATKTIAIGDQWNASAAADEVIRILAEQFGWEKV